MTQGRKTGGRDFQPGHKLAKGRPLIPDDLKEVKKLTPDIAERMLIKFMGMSMDEIKATAEDPTTPALHKIVCQIIVKAAEYGDTQRMEFLFNRTIGRVLDKVEVSAPTPFVIRRPDGSIELGTKIKDEE